MKKIGKSAAKNLKEKSVQNWIKYLQKADTLYRPEIQILILDSVLMARIALNGTTVCKSMGFLYSGKPSQEYFKFYPFALCISIKDCISMYFCKKKKTLQ